VRTAILFAAGTLVLFLGIIWWAIATDRQVWQEITADVLLLRELEHPARAVTVADLLPKGRCEWPVAK
jgi:hypothetical protein